MKKRSITQKTSIIVVVLVLFGIASLATIKLVFNDSQTSNPQKTSLRLKWVNQAQFAGYYMAQQNNHYRDSNLEVQIDPAGPNISPVQMVVSGTNDFGVAGADEIIKARAKGVPIVAIAVMFKQNPEALTSLKSAGIIKPQDLVGKRVGVIYGNDETLYREFLRLQGIDKSQITEVAAIPGNSQLLSGQVDALMAYSMNIPVLMKIQGYDTNVMAFSDYGVKFYGDTMFTTEAMIKNHPDTVKRFVQASLKGWQDAIDQPSLAVDRVMAINPSLNKAAQLGYLQGVVPLLANGNKMGVSDVAVWQKMQTTLVDQGVIKTPTNINKVFTNAYVK